MLPSRSVKRFKKENVEWNISSTLKNKTEMTRKKKKRLKVTYTKQFPQDCNPSVAVYLTDQPSTRPDTHSACLAGYHAQCRWCRKETRNNPARNWAVPVLLASFANLIIFLGCARPVVSISTAPPHTICDILKQPKEELAGLINGNLETLIITFNKTNNYME